MNAVLPVFRRSIGESWRSLLGWTAGVVGVLVLYLPLYPSIAGSGQLQEIIDSMPPELTSALGFDAIGTGAGYAQSTFFGLIGFLLLVIAATSWGSAAIAGAEETGRLELALAHGVGRAQYAVESGLSVLVRLLWLGAVAALVVVAMNGPADLGIDTGDAVAASAALVGLAFLSGSLALAVGALSGRRVSATASGAGIAVIGYVINAVANQLEHGGVLSAFSPYAWAYQGAPLASGADWVPLAALWGLGLAFVAVSAMALRRRDITG